MGVIAGTTVGVSVGAKVGRAEGIWVGTAVDVWVGATGVLEGAVVGTALGVLGISVSVGVGGMLVGSVRPQAASKSAAATNVIHFHVRS